MYKLLTIILIVIFFLSSCLFGDGSNTLIKTSSNNRQDKKAILFFRTAGATVPNSYQVTIADNDDKFDKTEVGNAFSVDNNRGETRLDSTSINFTWIANDTLQIEYDKKLRTFMQENNVEGVTIIYKTN